MDYSIKARVCPTCSKTQPVSSGSLCTRCGDPMDVTTQPAPASDFSMVDFTNRLFSNMGHLQTSGLLPPMKKVQS